MLKASHSNHSIVVLQASSATTKDAALIKLRQRVSCPVAETSDCQRSNLMPAKLKAKSAQREVMLAVKQPVIRLLRSRQSQVVGGRSAQNLPSLAGWPTVAFVVASARLSWQPATTLHTRSWGLPVSKAQSCCEVHTGHAQSYTAKCTLCKASKMLELREDVRSCKIAAASARLPQQLWGRLHPALKQGLPLLTSEQACVTSRHGRHRPAIGLAAGALATGRQHLQGLRGGTPARPFAAARPPPCTAAPEQHPSICWMSTS